MNRIPENTDLSFLLGQELQQVCIGRHQAILNFCNGSVSIETDIAHKSRLGESTAVYKTIMASAPMLVSFLNCTIANVGIKPPGTLVLEFSNGEALEIYDGNAEYESYQIRHG